TGQGQDASYVRGGERGSVSVGVTATYSSGKYFSAWGSKFNRSSEVRGGVEFSVRVHVRNHEHVRGNHTSRRVILAINIAVTGGHYYKHSFGGHFLHQVI